MVEREHTHCKKNQCFVKFFGIEITDSKDASDMVARCENEAIGRNLVTQELNQKVLPFTSSIA